MIGLYIIGFIVYAIVIFLHYYTINTDTNLPVLRVYHIPLIVVTSIIPVIPIVLGTMILCNWFCNIQADNWNLIIISKRLFDFFNRPIGYKYK